MDIRLSRRRLLWFSAVGVVSGIAGGSVFTWGRSTKLATSPRVPTTTPRTATTAGSTTTTSATTTTAAPAARTRQVICRDAWGAADAAAYKSHSIDRLTVHHSAGILHDNRVAPDHLLSYQRTHQSRGMADFAYHFFIDGRGNVYEGRDTATVGESFTSYDPTGHLLVVLDGNFEVQAVPALQLDALVDVLAWAAIEYNVAPSTIKGHRDYVGTACPGRALYELVRNGDLQARVANRLRAGVELGPVCGPAAIALLTAIRAGRS